jgi:hypothetical protein
MNSDKEVREGITRVQVAKTKKRKEKKYVVTESKEYNHKMICRAGSNFSNMH